MDVEVNNEVIAEDGRRCGELTSNTQKERGKAAALTHLVRLFPFLWFSENFPVAGNGDLGGFLSIKNGRSVRPRRRADGDSGILLTRKITGTRPHHGRRGETIWLRRRNVSD